MYPYGDQNLVKCLCGRWYEFYSHRVGDQSKCPRCKMNIIKEYEKQQEQDKKADLWSGGVTL